MNPWSVEHCSCPFIQQIKGVSLLLLGLDFILRGSVSGGEGRSFETPSLCFSDLFPAIFVALCIVKRPEYNLNKDVEVIRNKPVSVKY